jgi:aspartate kinase
MIELASTGAKVLEIRSVEFAKNYSVPVHVRSTFSDVEGTWLVNEEESMNDVLVSGVASDKNEAKITLVRVPDQPGLAAQIFGPIADAHIVVDMIIQNASEDGTTDLTFTVPKADHKKALSIMEKALCMPRALPLTPRSPKSRWSGWACARTPASRLKCSKYWPPKESTSR